MSQTSAETEPLQRIQATALDHIVLWVNDIERSKHFYVDLLGLSVLRERFGEESVSADPLDAENRCFLALGTHQIGLFQAKGGGVDGRARFNHFALRVEAGSRDELRSLLRANGIEVIGRENDPGCVYATDPDGHMVQLLTPLED